MGMTVTSVAGAVQRAHAAMATLEQVLNEADSRLGDGDTGSMLARVIERLSATDLGAEGDVGASFKALAYAAAAATGSSLGTLFSAALLAIGKKTSGQTDVAWSELSTLLETARDTMMMRGRASLGDKTVLDGLDAMAVAVASLDDAATIADAAITAMHDTLKRFRGKPCRIGRARMFADKSAELDDPGMLALSRLTEAVAGPAPAVG